MSKISVSMEKETLGRLLSSGALRAAEVKCLDCDSKAYVWKMNLQNVAHSLDMPENRLERMIKILNDCTGYKPQANKANQGLRRAKIQKSIYLKIILQYRG